MLEPDPILSEILDFLAASGMTKTAFGLGALNDSALVFQIEAGRDLRRSTRARIRKFIAAKRWSEAAD